MAKTWQSTTVEINPGAYSELSILSGKANIFMATNPSDEDIYIGMGDIPRADQYEKILKRNTTDVFGRPTPVSRVYFLNLSEHVISLRVWYTYDEDFDYMLLKSMSVDFEGMATDFLKYDGVITGVKTGITVPVSGTVLTQINNSLSSMLTIMQEEQGTNATILESINTILESL